MAKVRNKTITLRESELRGMLDDAERRGYISGRESARAASADALDDAKQQRERCREQMLRSAGQAIEANARAVIAIASAVERS